MNESIKTKLVETFKKLNDTLMPIDVRTEEWLEELLLRRVGIHRFEEPEYLRILFFILSQTDEKGEFTSTLEAFHLPNWGGEGRKEAKRRLMIALEALRKMKIFKLQWTGEESFRIDVGDLIKFSSVFNGFNRAFLPMDPKSLNRLHDLLFKCLRVQQFGAVEMMRILFFILSQANEESQVNITEKALFENLSRPNKKGDPTPGQFRLSLILDELGRRNAFQIHREKGVQLRIDGNEVFRFLEGWESKIQRAIVWKNEE